jgi:HEAT repeat protein
MQVSANRWALVLLGGVAATAAGCTNSSTTASGPTAEQIKQLRASQPQEQGPSPVAQALAAIPIRQWGVKETAVDAIARIGEPAVPALIQSLSDPDPGVRAQAARALARMSEKAQTALPALTAALDDPDEDVRIAATRALGQMGPVAAPALPALIKLLHEPDGKQTVTARK